MVFFLVINNVANNIVASTLLLTLDFPVTKARADCPEMTSCYFGAFLNPHPPVMLFYASFTIVGHADLKPPPPSGITPFMDVAYVGSACGTHSLPSPG